MVGLKEIIEAILFAADKPLDVNRLCRLFPETERPDKVAVKSALQELVDDYRARGIELKEVASGYRFQVRETLAPWVAKLNEERPARYSRALLETLAIIAYKQPITRGEVEAIRGVSLSTATLRMLLDHDWIKSVGHKQVPGRPALYATTPYFLDYFNLKSLQELPPLMSVETPLELGLIHREES